MKYLNRSKEFLKYRRLADGIRTGSIPETRKNIEKYKIAEAAYYKTIIESPASEINGWRNLPVARSCWESDSRQFETK